MVVLLKLLLAEQKKTNDLLAKHKLNLQLAKVTTLGERVEDTFLISGNELQNNKAQIEIETELLDAIAV